MTLPPSLPGVPELQLCRLRWKILNWQGQPEQITTTTLTSSTKVVQAGQSQVTLTQSFAGVQWVNGVMCNAAGDPWVDVIATEDPDINPSGFTITITARTASGLSIPVTLTTPVNGDINLTSVIPLSSSGGVVVTRGLPGVDGVDGADGVGFAAGTTAGYALVEQDLAYRASRWVDLAGRTWLKLHSSVALPGGQITVGSVGAAQLSADVAVPRPIDAATSIVLTETDQAGRMCRWVDDSGKTWLKLHPSVDVPGAPATFASATAVWALVDQTGRMAVWVDPAGGFNAARLGPGLTSLITGAIAAQVNAAIAPPIQAWGDSLTAGGWPTSAATELGVEFTNRGVGGQTVEQIAARQGAVPALATVPGDLVPASGSVTLSALTPKPYSNSSGTGTASGHGTLAGVPGVLARNHDTNTDTFTRDSAGTATWCPPATPWVPDEATTARDRTRVLWVGRNSFKTMPTATMVDYVRRMADYTGPLRRRFLVLEIPPAVGEETLPSPTADRVLLNAANAALKAAFPNEFVPIAQYLRGPALADMGLSPTAQDTTDISNGLTPTQLRSDGVHPTAAAQAQLGRLIATEITKRGWL